VGRQAVPACLFFVCHHTPTEPSAENGPLETSISLGDLHRKTIKFKCLVQCKQILAVRDGRVLVAHADPISGGQLSRFKCYG